MKHRARIIGIMMLPLIIPSEVQPQVSRQSTTIGVHTAFDVSDGRIEEERVGVQAHLPIKGSFEFVTQFSYFLSVSGWRANLTARARPRALGSLISIGSGVSISEFACAQPGCDGLTRTMQALAVIGFDVPRWSLGPFAELQCSQHSGQPRKRGCGAWNQDSHLVRSSFVSGVVLTTRPAADLSN